MFLMLLKAFPPAVTLTNISSQPPFNYVYRPIQLRLPTHSITFTDPFNYVYRPFNYKRL